MYVREVKIVELTTVIVAGKDDGAILLSYNRTAGVKVWTDTRDASQIY